ncbi:hypothetical protein BJ912DRAFT_930886 [Pholiota molesta]|nr:hypothetical protein BJ912DRAFT_930886 [Pholiota molesta]
MGRPRNASHFKSQAKTADIRRAVPGALAHNQAHTQKPNIWDVTLPAPKVYCGNSFPTRNLPPPSESLMDSATTFLKSVLSDVRATETPMRPLAISTDIMDCDLTPSELMDVDEVNLDDMNVDVVGPHALSLDAIPMDVAEDPWSMAIFAVRPSISAPPSFPAFTDHPMTPLQVCPATPLWKEVSVELSFARRELALIAKALQCLPVCTLHSPVQELPMESPVESIPDFAHLTHKSLIASAVISSAFHSPEHRSLGVDPGVEVVVKGIRNLDISDDSNPIPSTPFDEPIPLTVPEIQPEVLSPCSESSEFSQELDAFNTADLLGLDSIEPLHSTPIDGDNGKSSDAFGIWADIADLQLHSFYTDLSIPYLPDDGFITFPSSLIREVVSVFDLPAVDQQPRSTEAVGVLPCSEEVGVVDCVISSETRDKDAPGNAPCESVVLVPNNEPYEDGLFPSQIDSEEIVRMVKNRAERDAKKKAWKASTKERRRRKANARSASEPCSPFGPKSLSRMKINVSMPNHSPISTSISHKKLARADTKKGVSVKQGISNMDIFEAESGHSVEKNTTACGDWQGKHTACEVFAFAFYEAVSSQGEDSNHETTFLVFSASSVHNRSEYPAHTDTDVVRLFDHQQEGDHPLEPTTPIPEARVIHLPYAHSLMRQRDKCETPPKVPSSCPARTMGNPAFFAPNERHLPRRSTGYPRLEDISDDAFHSYAERSTRSPSPDATESQLVRSQKMPLYSAVHNAPKWVVTEATKNKVLPGAIPTTDYHEHIGPWTSTTAFQPRWFGRLKGVLFGW